MVILELDILDQQAHLVDLVGTESLDPRENEANLVPDSRDNPVPPEHLEDLAILV